MRDYSIHSDFERDLQRLARYSVDWAEAVVDLVDILFAEGSMPESASPHSLTNRRGCMSGFWECHAESNVLIIYRVTESRILLRRICTHEELEACRFADEWPHK